MCIRDRSDANDSVLSLSFSGSEIAVFILVVLVVSLEFGGAEGEGKTSTPSGE